MTTPRNPRPRAVPDKPAGIALNLDTMKREGEVADDFVVVLEGKPRKFTDPFELDWQDAAQINDPVAMFAKALSAQDHADLMAAKIPVWKINTLAETYMRHFGFDRDAQGNFIASTT